MQPTIYLPGNPKPAYQFTPQKPEAFHNHHHISMTPTSPRANLQYIRMDERPHSHNLSMNNAKNPTISSSNQSKLYSLENIMKPLRNHTQKVGVVSGQEAPHHTRYGQMKSSYMGPDSREVAYIKEKEAITENHKLVKKLPRSSQTNISHSQVETNATEKKIDPLNEIITFQKRRTEIEQPSVLTANTNSISYKRMDPVERAKMRKSSFDLGDTWAKPLQKKKTQRKFTLNDFQRINELGTGKYGKVFLVKEKQTEFVCALKIIEKQMLKDEQITEQFIRQLKIQLFLNHPNIIKMYGYFDDSMNIYIILEVALGGQLYKQVKKGTSLGEPRIAVIMRQVVSAVNELHSNHIIHRDIKPENIVLNENIVKLCDFGWSVYHGQTLRSTFCGTPLYVSPEILKGNNYDEKIDIWSLGIMMYEMLTGENPFKITQEDELIKIIKDAVTFPSYANISAEAKDFVMCCLQKNPSDRKNIRELMHHQFFKKYPEKGSERKMV